MREREGPGFRQNLTQSMRVWRAHPLLPVLSLLVFAGIMVVRYSVLLGSGATARCVFHVPRPPGCHAVSSPVLGLLEFLDWPVVLFSVGFVGVERIWYLRAFRGLPMRAGEIWTMAWRFFWRFAALGLVFLLPLVPVAILLIAKQRFALALLIASLLWVIIDFALTFVTSALAFTTHRISEAVAIGIQMIRREWPSSAPYSLIPPLATLLVARTVAGPVVGLAGAIALTVIGASLNLWFKGATSAFYLRHNPVPSDDGAAFVRDRRQKFGPESGANW